MNWKVILLSQIYLGNDTFSRVNGVQYDGSCVEGGSLIMMDILSWILRHSEDRGSKSGRRGQKGPRKRGGH